MASYATMIYFISFGVWKVVSGTMMIMLLVATEMVVAGMLFMMIHSWMMYGFIQCIVTLIVVAVIEGVVGLLILTKIFRESTMYSSFTLMF